MTNYNTIYSAGDIESVRINPQLYIGDVTTPMHLLEEVLDNSLDEAMNGFASKIIISIDTKNDIITISDDGRGIPTGEQNGTPIPILVCSKLHTSAKMKDKSSVYKVSSGLHGIGLVAVAALSAFIKIDIIRDNRKFSYLGKYKNDKEIDWIINKPEPVDTNKTGTIISFKPSSKYFESTKIDVDRLLKRLKLISVFENTEFTIVLIVDNEILFKSSENKDIDTFLKNFFKNSQYISEIKKVHLKNGNNILDIYFYYDYSRIEKQQYSMINNLELERGDHLTWFNDSLKKFLYKKYKKNEQFKNIKPQEDDFLIGLRLFMNCFLEEAKYSSQTKDELKKSHSWFNKNFLKDLEKHLENIFNNDTTLVTNLLNHISRYRLQMNIKSLENKKSGTKKRNNKIELSPNLVEAEGDKDVTLFIVEGESAAGTLIQCRDPKKHAIYKLKGKGLVNVETSKLEKILTNEVAKDLLLSLGLYSIKSGKLNKINDNSRFSKVIILADADVDGKHIVTLLLKFFNMFGQELIEQGKLFIGLTPLYGTYDKSTKKFIPIWDESKVKEYLNKGYKISRHKGLGEFSPDELEIVAIKNPRLISVTFQMC